MQYFRLDNTSLSGMPPHDAVLGGLPGLTRLKHEVAQGRCRLPGAATRLSSPSSGSWTSATATSQVCTCYPGCPRWPPPSLTHPPAGSVPGEWGSANGSFLALRTLALNNCPSLVGTLPQSLARCGTMLYSVRRQEQALSRKLSSCVVQLEESHGELASSV